MAITGSIGTAALDWTCTRTTLNPLPTAYMDFPVSFSPALGYK